MPRLFFNVFDGVVTIDREGHELSDIEAIPKRRPQDPTSDAAGRGEGSG